MKIITDKKELTPILLEEILHNTKSFEQVEVKKIIIKRNLPTISSKLCFIHVIYSERSPKSAPKRFVLKMSKKGINPEVFKNEFRTYFLLFCEFRSTILTI